MIDDKSVMIEMQNGRRTVFQIFSSFGNDMLPNREGLVIESKIVNSRMKTAACFEGMLFALSGFERRDSGVVPFIRLFDSYMVETKTTTRYSRA